ncbi:hypothetical protein KIN20_036520 [Parelaphostrongylus tenuis]|uniref:Uncharacterized protein n=1 Tax=Parelaphostrongylus tenuis TaxID=148309 RepID=A0AAD5WLQ7_PARTN|nr:hypothetical protein KIN20_036520 [Parelaphostrongylus tenuis]
MNGKSPLFLVLIIIVQLTFTTTGYIQDSIPPEVKQPEWRDLGWAWRKRSSSFPERILRSMPLVKKNPDWHDLGWTWGRRK